MPQLLRSCVGFSSGVEKEMESKRRMGCSGCCRSMGVLFNLRKKTNMKPWLIAAKIFVRFKIWSVTFRTVLLICWKEPNSQTTSHFVVMMPLSSSVCGSAHAPVAPAGPDRSISRVHCCKCWLTWNAEQVRGRLSPSRSEFCLRSATAWKHGRLQSKCTGKFALRR